MENKVSKKSKGKTLLLSPKIHSKLKLEAEKAKKQLHSGFGDDIVILGIREYRRVKKITNCVN